jgi:hypothetical protein
MIVTRNQSSSIGKWDVATLLAMLLATLVALSWFSFEGLSTFADDSVSYLLMAQCWSPWHEAGPAQLAACVNENYPPLFPLLLAVTGGDQHWGVARALMIAGWVLTGLLFWGWGRHLFGPPIAFGMALLYLSVPMNWLMMFGILSENTYLTLTLATLFLAERRFATPVDAGKSHRGVVIVMTLLASACTLTRSIGLAIPIGLLAAALISRLRVGICTTNQRELALSGFVALCIGLAWYGLNSPGSGSSLYVSDLEKVRESTHQIADLWPLVEPQALRLVESWVNAFTIYWRYPSQPNVIITGGLGFLVIVGWLWRLWLGHADAWYLAVYIAVILIWPYPGQVPRFLHGIFPLLLLQAFSLFTYWPRGHDKWTQRSWILASLLLLSLAATLPTNAFLYHRAQTGRVEGGNAGLAIEFYLFADRDRALHRAMQQRRLMADMSQIEMLTEPEARILWFTPAYVNLMTGRFGVDLQDWSALKHLRDLAQALAEVEVDYVLLTQIHPRDTRVSFDGLRLEPAFLPLSEPVWRAFDPDGQDRTVLLRIDAERLAPFLKQGDPNE